MASQKWGTILDQLFKGQDRYNQEERIRKLAPEVFDFKLSHVTFQPNDSQNRVTFHFHSVNVKNTTIVRKIHWKTSQKFSLLIQTIQHTQEGDKILKTTENTYRPKHHQQPEQQSKWNELQSILQQWMTVRNY